MREKWISVVGSGGKTSLLYAMGRQLAEEGKRVLLTTTTHLAMWVPPDIPCYTDVAGEEKMPFSRGRPVLWAIPTSTGRRMGPSVEQLERVAPLFDHIICEADGSRGLPLKWHGDHEPCLPEYTQRIYYVVGLSGVGQSAGEVLHRWEQSPYEQNHRLESKDVLALICRGVEHMKTDVPVCVVLNQADDPASRSQGQWLAHQLEVWGVLARVCAIQKEGFSIVDFDTRSR